MRATVLLSVKENGAWIWRWEGLQVGPLVGVVVWFDRGRGTVTCLPRGAEVRTQDVGVLFPSFS